MLCARALPGRMTFNDFILQQVSGFVYGFVTGAVSADVWSDMVRVGRIWSGQGRGWSRVDGFG